MPASLEWSIGLITTKPNDESWKELFDALSLFFSDVHFASPEDVLKKGFNYNFIFTDNKNIFIRVQEDSAIGCLYLPIPSMRRHVAELIRTMAYSFMTPDAYKD